MCLFLSIDLIGFSQETSQETDTTTADIESVEAISAPFILVLMLATLSWFSM